MQLLFLLPLALATSMKKPTQCLATWEIPAGGSVLQEQRSTSKTPWSDFPEQFPAIATSPALAPVEVTRKFATENQPWLVFSDDRNTAGVDQRWFGDLSAVDVNRVQAKEQKTIGTLTPEGMKIPGEQLLEFLVTAEIVRTRWHVESTVCLERASTEQGTFTAKVSGEHVYFTNERNKDPFVFTFWIHPTGEMGISGL